MAWIGPKRPSEHADEASKRIFPIAGGRARCELLHLADTLGTNVFKTGQPTEMVTAKDMAKQPNKSMYYVQFGYLVNRTGSLGAAFMNDVLKEFDVPLPIWQILLILSEFREQTISELASHTGIEMSYLSRTVLKAEQRGFVTRAKSDKDKRVTYIKLAMGGTQTIRKILPKTRILQGIIFRGLSDADIETTAQTLKVVYDNLASNVGAVSEDTNRKLIVAQRTGKYAARS